MNTNWVLGKLISKINQHRGILSLAMTTMKTEITTLNHPEDYKDYDEYSVATAEETIEKSLLIWSEYINQPKK